MIKTFKQKKFILNFIDNFYLKKIVKKLRTTEQKTIIFT